MFGKSIIILPELVALPISGTSPDFVIVALEEKRNNQRGIKKQAGEEFLKRRKTEV